jgi:hypothetical protein
MQLKLMSRCSNDRFSHIVLKNARLQSMWSKRMKHSAGEYRRDKSYLWAQCDQCPLHTRTTGLLTLILANDAIMFSFSSRKLAINNLTALIRNEAYGLIGSPVPARAVCQNDRLASARISLPQHKLSGPAPNRSFWQTALAGTGDPIRP